MQKIHFFFIQDTLVKIFDELLNVHFVSPEAFGIIQSKTDGIETGIASALAQLESNSEVQKNIAATTTQQDDYRSRVNEAKQNASEMNEKIEKEKNKITEEKKSLEDTTTEVGRRTDFEGDRVEQSQEQKKQCNSGSLQQARLFSP